MRVRLYALLVALTSILFFQMELYKLPRFDIKFYHSQL